MGEDHSFSNSYKAEQRQPRMETLYEHAPSAGITNVITLAIYFTHFLAGGNSHAGTLAWESESRFYSLFCHSPAGSWQSEQHPAKEASTASLKISLRKCNSMKTKPVKGQGPEPPSKQQEVPGSGRWCHCHKWSSWQRCWTRPGAAWHRGICAHGLWRK